MTPWPPVVSGLPISPRVNRAVYTRRPNPESGPAIAVHACPAARQRQAERGRANDAVGRHNERRSGNRHARAAVAADDPERIVQYQMYRDEAADPPALVCQVGTTAASLSPALYRGPPRHAEGARRLDAARQRRRAEAGRRGHRRGLGALGGQPGRRLVRAQEGPARPLRRCTSRRCSRRSAWPKSSTTRRTTACGRSKKRYVRTRTGDVSVGGASCAAQHAPQGKPFSSDSIAGVGGSAGAGKLMQGTVATQEVSCATGGCLSRSSRPRISGTSASGTT